jgi:hypothetical protein
MMVGWLPAARSPVTFVAILLGPGVDFKASQFI